MPLTHRGIATGGRFVTGHCREDLPLELDWDGLADPDTTLVVYMGAAHIGEIAKKLGAAGLDPSTPVLPMVAIWAIFTVVVFVAEPLFLHRWFHARAAKDPVGTLRLVVRMHRVLLTASLVTVGAAVLGAHGGL